MPSTFTTFTSPATESNKAYTSKLKKPRDDYRVIFADQVKYPKNKVWLRDDRGIIKKDVAGNKLFELVVDTEQMLEAPRKIFDNAEEYMRWCRHRTTFQEIADDDFEEEEPLIEDLNSDLIRD